MKFGKENVVQLKNIIPKDHVFEPEKVYLQIGIDDCALLNNY